MASADVAQRDFHFDSGDHDMRGCFTFVSALMSLLNGLASLENNQLDIVLQRVRNADEELTKDCDWPGKTVLRGLCNLVAGVVEIMQGMPSRGVWHVLRSWLWLRNLEVEALNYEGYERCCVRSTALLALGVFNLFVSMLPPTAMKAAGWATGFAGGRDVALAQLQSCWEEGGIQAPFAGLVLIGFSVDVSSFLGELRAERAKRHTTARSILDWAKKNYPDAFFFKGLESGYLAATQDLEGAIAELEEIRASVQNLPAFLFLVNVRRATFLLSLFRWKDAGDAFSDAVQVYRSVGRRALCPSLSLNSHLCYLRADCAERAAEMLALCRSYREEKKKWSPLDRVSLRQAETAHRYAQAASASSPADADAGPARADEGQEDGEEASDSYQLGEQKWRPMLLLYLKISCVYRGVNFMQHAAAQEFLQMVQDEARNHEDADGQCMAFCIQAEAMRQSENWDEALRLAGEGIALQPQLSPAGVKTGCLHFCHLVLAYSQYALGRPSLAQEALTKLSSLSVSDHFFQKQVEFKATHLRFLVGAEFEESYREISVAARSKVRLVVDVEEGTSVQWDFILNGFTIDFVAIFTPKKEGVESQELQRVEQHQAQDGPCEGSSGTLEAGSLELVFSNSFSMLRGKSLQCRVQPESLTIREEAC
ncbi:Ank3 [Symbiodinium pilosum]|uniref:Ank3 protein n=1 Tax=Symbiodinium pilosum TaxID=2952 RepID=A0A812R398_SYMPI|nr:Ank3 [Symbiodinium pilosum]